MKLIIDIPYEAYYTFKCDLGKGNLNALAEIVANGTPLSTEGDLISRSVLKEVIKANHYLLSAKNNSTDYGMFTTGIMQAIDNAPTVTPFTQLEKEEIADAITYLLDAELLEENGYTEEVINALKSALKKVGGAE